jgi:chromosome segregation ATPase
VNGENPPQASNGIPVESSATVVELQSALDRQSKELAESRHRLSEYQFRMKDLEEKYRLTDERYTSLNKDYTSNIEISKKHQRDLKDLIALKEEQEYRISSLEQRYLNLQRECSSFTDINNRLETELAIRENSLKHAEERYKNLQTKLDQTEQKYEQLFKRQQNNSEGTGNVATSTSGIDLTPRAIALAQVSPICFFFF